MQMHCMTFEYYIAFPSPTPICGGSSLVKSCDTIPKYFCALQAGSDVRVVDRSILGRLQVALLLYYLLVETV